MATSRLTQYEDNETGSALSLAKPLAPEEIRAGDYVSLLHVFYDVPSFFWCSDAVTQRREELVRLCYIPESGGVPLKVKAVCLPFVLVKHPMGGKRTLDVRKVRLARLDREYAAAAWKMRKQDQGKLDCR
ncbi:hypothetical protein [Bythopirellula polymerisocia]|uniref:Uncharacterized protein n=1 Tax=Bythopirellula polymerisocia TaxID=2528003 RepID=A0A5C6D344_9BACT|nr:hypothetical protein [Bythopirellula polymerisocia]TWU29279.1 hypothetical protein Pla144_00550 [Bythopirellula polymerisocia]